MVEGSKLQFCSVYRSPNSSVENNVNLITMIRELSTRDKTNVVIAGDINYLNINWLLMNNSTREEDKEFKFIEAIRTSFMFQKLINQQKTGALTSLWTWCG